jgi:hypothetical protein
VALAVALTSIGWLPTTSAAQETEKNPKNKKTCFNVRDTRSYTALHDRYVYVKCVRKKHYLLTIDQGCRGMMNSFGVSITNDFNRVCSHSGAMISFREYSQPKRCRILEVEAVEDLEAAEEMVEERVSREEE